ncbi:MAG: iron-sulfur cluster assembly scaffold protein, partial [Candidatus Pacebacteria bacterium]|nr:iron-sulfur cluster assembly scaffold protein [Candidatus Paceibacterota bacterium]
CGHAIAISDMICELIKGKTLDDALKVGYEDIKEEIGPVPPVKIHCAALAQAGVKAAVEDYKKKNK